MKLFPVKAKARIYFINIYTSVLILKDVSAKHNLARTNKYIRVCMYTYVCVCVYIYTHIVSNSMMSPLGALKAVIHLCTKREKYIFTMI